MVLNFVLVGWALLLAQRPGRGEACQPRSWRDRARQKRPEGDLPDMAFQTSDTLVDYKHLLKIEFYREIKWKASCLPKLS